MLAFLAVTAMTGADASPALDRYVSFMRRADQLTVRVAADQMDGRPGGQGSLVWRRPDRQAFSVTWGPARYRFRQLGTRTIEIDDAGRMYQELTVGRNLVPPPAEMYALPEFAYPDVLLATDLRRVVPGGTWTHVGSRKEGARSIDHVRGAGQVRQTRIQLDAHIDDLGRLVRYELSRSSAQENFRVRVTLSGYAPTAPKDDTAFAVRPPTGYSPFRMPEPPTMLPRGQVAPLTGWTDAAGAAVDLRTRHQGWLLIVVTAPDCDVSAAAEPTLRQLAGMLREKGGSLVELSLGGRPTNARDAQRPLYVDRNGRLERALGVPATPSFYLVGPNNRVARLWLGFDRANPKPLVDELSGALAGN